MTMQQARPLQAVPISRDAYAPYGDLIAADDSRPFKPANFGRAKRFNYLADVLNLRPETGRFNLCLFRCNAFLDANISVELLEKHPLSTQVFIPMQDGRYITIVARGGDEPDLSTLAAFVIEGPQGITYRPGIWHYPMTALGKPLDLACVVYEDDTQNDCVIAKLPDPVVVQIP